MRPEDALFVREPGAGESGAPPVGDAGGEAASRPSAAAAGGLRSPEAA